MNEQNHIDQRTRDLLNGSIDGELNSAEQKELDQLLAASEEVRALHEEFKTIAGLLNDIPDLEPPAYLHDAITSQVRLPVNAGAQADKPGLFSRWFAQPWLRNGLGVAAALVLTIGIYQSGSENLSPRDTSRMTGTVMKSPDVMLIDSTRFNGDQINSKVELYYESGLLMVDVRLESDGLAVVKLDFSDQDFDYKGINGLENPAADVAVASGSIRVSGSGQQHFELLLRSTTDLLQDIPPPLILEFFADNELVHEAELDGFTQMCVNSESLN